MARRSPRGTGAGGALALACLLCPRAARAVEVGADAAPSAGASTWRGDLVAGGQLRLAARFARVIAVDFVGWEMFGSVDRRANTGLTLGATGFLPLGRVTPFARLFVLHQHEEGWVSVTHQPMGTLFGIGAGIRHRAGGGATLGVEVPMGGQRGRSWHLSGGATTAWFPDAVIGPAAYFVGFFGVGGNLELRVAE
ncbi:MAG: hypothetical protein IT374_11525 [Polyangiaceae bacterium]|nr:hypothetical protein [Polyangiaceae bacterium]